MHSPLPDASALEAGIPEDETPSRLSRVQDNVRNLLRNSRFVPVNSSPQGSPTRNPHHVNYGLATPPNPPTRTQYQPAALSSPTESTASTPSPTAPAQTCQIPGILFPPTSYEYAVQQMAHQSAMFNTRAVMALNHPDLSDPSLAVYAQQKAERRQRRAWKRSRNGSTRQAAVQAGSSQCVLCVLAALLLAAIVATYLVLATSSTHVTATFHILFVLGILLATIVFAHALVRLFVLPGSSRKARGLFVVPLRRSKHKRHRQHQQQTGHLHVIPTVAISAPAFVPPAPIRVHMPTDEVKPDGHEPQATAASEVAVPRNDWDKDVETVPNPPPAYGRWRGSVRANPDFLHWQAVPSPIDSIGPGIPSPTYEEAMLAQRTGPPSYVTRDSPARRREVREVGTQADGAGAQPQSAEPEMVEGAGIGLGV